MADCVYQDTIEDRRATHVLRKELSMKDVINYNIDDYGVLRVYRGNAILFEAQDFLSTPRSEVEKFIDENLEEMGEEYVVQD